MKILITGASGFVGKAVVKRLLEAGHTLLILLRSRNEKVVFKNFPQSKISFLQSDLQNIHKHIVPIKRFKPDAGIHLAWEGIPSADLKLNLKNLEGGLNCIEALPKAGCKTIFVAGSCHEYGEPGIKVRETSPLNPYNALYAAKAALYFLGSKIAEQYNVRFLWGRLGFIYGPGQRKAALIPYLIDCLQNGSVPKIRNLSGGNDFIYVDDVADAIAAIIRKKNIGMNEIYNIGSGKLTSVGKVIRMLYQKYKIPLPKALRVTKKSQGFYMDISKIKKEIGWKPHINMEQGIQKILDYNKHV